MAKKKKNKGSKIKLPPGRIVSHAPPQTINLSFHLVPIESEEDREFAARMRARRGEPEAPAPSLDETWLSLDLGRGAEHACEHLNSIRGRAIHPETKRLIWDLFEHLAWAELPEPRAAMLKGRGTVCFAWTGVPAEGARIIHCEGLLTGDVYLYEDFIQQHPAKHWSYPNLHHSGNMAVFVNELKAWIL